MYPLEQRIDQQLRKHNLPLPTLIFPEADDPRVISAAARLVPFAKIVLVRSRAEVERDVLERDIPLGVSRRRFFSSARFVEPGEDPVHLEEMARTLCEKLAARGEAADLATARRLVREDPVFYAIMAVALGDADAVLGGVTHASADFFKPCLRLLDKERTVFEMGLFALPDSHPAGLFHNNLVVFADVALNPEPSPERLADIAVGACTTLRRIIPVEDLPEVNGAILSYSTRGSGHGPSVERVRAAEPIINGMLAELRARDPLFETVNIATELQVSCAISLKAARSKLREEVDLNPAYGRSNVLIASSLDTGNLLYHIYSTRYPDAQTVLTIGGLYDRALDFSRSSTPDDVVLGGKVLILRLMTSGHYRRTPRDTFFPNYRILTVNPLTPETEVVLYEGTFELGREILQHDEQLIHRPPLEQLTERLDAVRGCCARLGVDPTQLDAVVGRGGLILPVESGTYRVGERMLVDLSVGRSGVHPTNLGAILAHELVRGGRAQVFTADPVVVDELDATARLTGLPSSEQEAAWHALSQKAAAKTYAERQNQDYEELNLIVAHLGEGISVGAHQQGRCVKVRNALYDGPMSMERAGSLPGGDLIELCFSGLSREEVERKVVWHGGVKAYLGTGDLDEVERRIQAGDEQASLIFDAMVEQIAAEIASLVPKFKGAPIDQILLTGPLAVSRRLTRDVERMLAGLGLGITVYEGNREAPALRDAALRVLRGLEEAREYLPLRDRL